MAPFIPYSCQLIEDDDIEAVVAVLRSDWLTQGPNIEQFEKAVAGYCGVPHGIAMSNATAGLHLVCMALGVGAGDLVWTSPLSFTASSNCALYVGAQVDFVDIDPATGNMCVQALTEKLEVAKRTGRLPKLVIPVHYAGRACDMDAMGALKDKYGFALVEDAAHALGAHYANGAAIGGHAASDAVVFSFHPVKPITTGEGGVVVTRDAKLADKVRLLRTHGITRDAALLQQTNMPAWYYEQQELGYNYRITDFQAALGTSQMGKLNRFIAARRAVAARYDVLLQGLPLLLPPLDARSGWHLYPIQLDTTRCSVGRDTVFEQMRAQSIGVNVHYIPIHLQPYYQALGFTQGQFPKAEKFFAHCLSLPVHPRLTQADQDVVVAALKNILDASLPANTNMKR